MTKYPLLRVIHWGPLIALSIINCVTFTTLFLTSFWLSLTDGFISLINYIFYYSFIGTTLYNFFSAIFIGPGFVSHNWKPSNSEHIQYLQFCTQCNAYKVPRSHHCRRCNRCVLKMDHHCPWINNCCGYRNHSYFTLFLLSAVLGSIHSIILLTIGLYRAFYFNWYAYNDRPDRLVYISMTSLLLGVFSIGLSVGVIIAVGGLLIIQIKIIVRNQTSIEEWIVAKALSRKREDVFVFPYNIGFFNNIKQVLFEAKDNGITWPVIEGTNQYTLTVEQLLQKEEKRIRSSDYTAIANYNGNWFPIFSQGCSVCISFPISDEPRIVINSGDNIVVTRWKKHWLYGQKCKSINTNNSVNDRERGWFPRKCVVKVIKANNSFCFNTQNTINVHKHENEIIVNNKLSKKLN